MDRAAFERLTPAARREDSIAGHRSEYLIADASKPGQFGGRPNSRCWG